MSWRVSRLSDAAKLSRVWCVIATGLAAQACTEESKTPGQIVLSVSTDMALPDQVDTIRVQVQVHGMSFLDQSYEVGTGYTPIPATLTLLEGSDPSTPVNVRVAGSKQGKWRTFREAITTIPSGRTASLRMPVQWLCDGTARGIPPKDASGLEEPGVESTCDAGNTCKAGKCVPLEIEPTTLIDFTPQSVFGDSVDPEEGACFDTVACMIKGTVAEPDGRCTIEKPAADSINVALRVTADGICDSTATVCFVPLDGESEEGWTVRDNRIALPEVACEKLAEGVVNAVYVSTECQTKTEMFPPCGDWSSVRDKKPITPATADMPEKLPAASRLASLVKTGSKARPCCPLMSQDGVLYTCLCTDKTETNLVKVDLASPETSAAVAELTPSEERDAIDFAATVFDGALYWADDRRVQRTPLPGTDAPDTPLPFDASIFETASLLADSDAMYTLVSGGPSTGDAAVQLLKLEHGGAATYFDTAGNKPVYQFDQDESGVYVVTDVDEPIANGATERTSSVTRIDKASGERSTVLAEQVIRITDRQHGGYVGVQVDGEALFALFEEAPDDEGIVHVQVHAIDVSEGSTRSDPKVVYDTHIDPEAAQVALIGAIDRSVALSRIEYDARNPAAPVVRSASLIVVDEAGGTQLIVADFARDFAYPGLASDAEHIYWLNSSGSIYAFPRAALEGRNDATRAP